MSHITEWSANCQIFLMHSTLYANQRLIWYMQCMQLDAPETVEPYMHKPNKSTCCLV